MKKTLMTLLAGVLFATCGNSQSMKPIKLDAPNTERGTAVMKALQQRESVREYSDKVLVLSDLSDLLWAANGFNRADKRTAPTARNFQPIDLYVLMAEGAYLYDAQNSQLVPVTREDLRPAVSAGQDYPAKAPVVLLIVADGKRLGDAKSESEPTPEVIRMATAYDAGIVSQNISLFASGCGLATVCRGMMDHAALATALKLTDQHVIHLNHPVGYRKE